jgi:hypothetical protein
MAYVSAANLKLYLGITETTDDMLLATLIGAAQAIINAYCGQSFEASADTTRHFQANRYQGGPGTGYGVGAGYGYFQPSISGGGDALDLDLFLDAPLCQITTVTNGDGVLVASTDYVALPLNDTPKYALRLRRASGLYWTYGDDWETDTIDIVGRWAYSISAPADIVQACTRLAAYLYRQKNNSGDLDRGLVIGAGAAILPTDLPRDLKMILAPYVRVIP